MATPWTWYAARASGLVAWGLATASVLWGLFLSTRVTRGRPSRSWLLDLHRFLGGLAVVFTLVHVVALIADSYIEFSIVDVLVPFASGWQPWAVAWGVVAFWILLAIELTSLAKARLPVRVWRAVHMASFPLFAFATIHAITAGTDAGNGLVVVTFVAAIASVCGLTAIRVAAPPSEPPRPRAARQSAGAGSPARLVARTSVAGAARVEESRTPSVMPTVPPVTPDGSAVEFDYPPLRPSSSHWSTGA